MPFDPDKFLAEGKAPAFDPDKFLAEAPVEKGNTGLVNSAFNVVEGAGSAAAPLVNKALTPVRSVLDQADRFTFRPARRFIGDLQKGAPVGKAYGNALNGMVNDEPAPSGREVMEAGAKRSGNDWELKHLSEAVPGLYSPTGKGWRLQKGGMLDPSTASVAGAGLDALNPGTALAMRAPAPAAAIEAPVAQEVAQAARMTPEESVSHLMGVKNNTLSPESLAAQAPGHVPAVAESNVSKILDSIAKRAPTVGGVAGGILGGPVGAAKGYAIGKGVQKAIPYVKSSVDWTLKKAAGTKYSQSLSAAAQRGDGSFAVTYFLKQQTDPEFRTLMENNGDQ